MIHSMFNKILLPTCIIQEAETVDDLLIFWKGL